MKKFNFFVPLDTRLEKSEKDGQEIYYFEGLASNDTTDADEESMNTAGFDLSEFKFVNWNHGQGPEDQIGIPIESKITPEGNFYVKGALFNTTQRGKDTIDLMQSLALSNKELGTNTQLGISVEGQVLERGLLNSKKVERAKITAIAICPFPKNPSTWASLIRKGFIEDELNTKSDQKEISKPIKKSIIIDRVIDNERVIVDSNLNITKLKVKNS